MIHCFYLHRQAKFSFLLFITAYLFSAQLYSKPQGVTMEFTVSMEQPATHTYQVLLRCSGITGDSVDLTMPAWTTGYYQILDFAKEVSGFNATDADGKEVTWKKIALNTWRLYHHGNPLKVNYDVKATRSFVATSYIDEERGYISPAGMFMHIKGSIAQAATVIIKPYSKWKDVATGLERVPGKENTFVSPDFDVLYDSPILTGNLDSLPVFMVKGVPHRFVGYKLGDFDRKQFVSDLTKIVEAATDIIGDIPYKEYTFLSIGPGQGGIEHSNSASISFNGAGLASREGRIRLLSFIAHEYFHHYNVKRIRPIELGPFDYDKGSRTRSLWVSEGLSVYYEYLLLKRAGLITDNELFDLFRANMKAFENKPGKQFQTLAQASYETWSDGPFGRTGDEVNKTISYYDKGPVVGALLNFVIQHATGNRKSLDDVMRTLYYTYYKQKKRGFTEEELRSVIETTAGQPLPEIFDYIYTTKEIDYPKYMAYAGLAIDTATKTIPGAYTGLAARMRGDSMMITAVDWNSPAWNAGLRARDILLMIDGRKADMATLKEIMAQKNKGNRIAVSVLHQGMITTSQPEISEKHERNFIITRHPAANETESAILKSWLREN